MCNLDRATHINEAMNEVKARKCLSKIYIFVVSHTQVHRYKCFMVLRKIENQ